MRRFYYLSICLIFISLLLGYYFIQARLLRLPGTVRLTVSTTGSKLIQHIHIQEATTGTTLVDSKVLTPAHFYLPQGRYVVTAWVSGRFGSDMAFESKPRVVELRRATTISLPLYTLW